MPQSSSNGEPKRKPKPASKPKPYPISHIIIEEIRNQPPKIFCSVKTAGVALNLGKTSIYKLMREQKIAYVKQYGRTLIYLQSVHEYAASLRKNGGAA